MPDAHHTPIPSPDSISDKEFHALLERYPACISAISDAKGAKPGQKTLVSLDEYRYKTAPNTFGAGGSTKLPMDLDDVKTLVEWKLRHGKFRPTLMKLLSSNDASFVRDAVQQAVKHYRDKADVFGAIELLTQLKGIGPATASLLLAVHDPEDVIFFSDEAFYWLCCGGSRTPLKYNMKEYTELTERSNALTKRLGVKAVDVERVAYVLFNDQSPGQRQTESTSCAFELQPSSSANTTDENKKQDKQIAKRKSSAVQVDVETSLRRSKRGKQA